MSRPRFVLLCIAAFTYTTNALTINVPGGTTDCYFYTADAASEVHLDYEVVSAEGMTAVAVSQGDGFPDIPVLNIEEKVRDRVSWKTPDRADGADIDGEGEILYKICFSAKGGLVVRGSRDISFTLHQNVGNLGVYGAKAQQIDPIDKAVRSLQERVDSLKDAVDYMAMREARQHRTNETANSRIVSWSSLEVLSILIVTVSQVVYMKRFLETRRRI